MSLRGAVPGDEAISSKLKTIGHLKHKIASGEYALAMTGGNRWKFVMHEKQYCVYIMTNSRHTVLYTGVTNDLQRRVLEHRSKTAGSFTKKYDVNQLVYFECGDDVNVAIAREKQIKAGPRRKKVELINSLNPEWKDLCAELWR